MSLSVATVVSFLRRCISLWHFSEFFHLNVMWQTVQTNGFASLWMRLWFHSVERRLKRDWQI